MNEKAWLELASSRLEVIRAALRMFGILEHLTSLHDRDGNQMTIDALFAEIQDKIYKRMEKGVNEYEAAHKDKAHH